MLCLFGADMPCSGMRRRRGILPDLGVDVRQIDALSIQRPIRSSPASATFGAIG